MKERPILFSGPMVRALLAGTKTQTRRVVKKLPITLNRETNSLEVDVENIANGRFAKLVACPYGQPGDRLWMRESFSGPWCMEAQDGIAAAPPSKWGESSQIWYWADGEPTHGDWTRPRPSIHMPRWASRITLEITSVRVETLGIISHEDALAEGVSSIEEYKALWININGAWLPETWVWVVDFRMVLN